MEIFLIKKKDSHISELYELLKTRKFSISHETLPSFKEHYEFVINNPYRKWFFLKKEKASLGTAYLSYENVIGINLINPNKKNYIEVLEHLFLTEKPLKEIKSVRSKYFSVNTRPDNLLLIEALRELGMIHIQESYILKKDI